MIIDNILFFILNLLYFEQIKSTLENTEDNNPESGNSTSVDWNYLNYP